MPTRSSVIRARDARSSQARPAGPGQGWLGNTTYQLWYDDWYYNDLQESDELYLGPFCFGPVRLDLDATGDVYLRLVMVPSTGATR